MNATTENFMKEAGIIREDEFGFTVPGTSGIFLREGEDCTPAELVQKIVGAGKNRHRVEIFNLIATPIS